VRQITKELPAPPAEGRIPEVSPDVRSRQQRIGSVFAYFAVSVQDCTEEVPI
jgi:hypothetical protein